MPKENGHHLKIKTNDRLAYRDPGIGVKDLLIKTPKEVKRKRPPVKQISKLN